MFLCGFILSWIIIAIIIFIKENTRCNNIISDIIDIIIMFPIFIIIIPIYTLCKIFTKQWQNVVTPVDRNRWDNLLKKYDIKYIQIKNFYICYDKNATWINKIFFVRKKREKVKNENK